MSTVLPTRNFLTMCHMLWWNVWTTGWSLMSDSFGRLHISFSGFVMPIVHSRFEDKRPSLKDPECIHEHHTVYARLIQAPSGGPEVVEVERSNCVPGVSGGAYGEMPVPTGALCPTVSTALYALENGKKLYEPFTLSLCWLVSDTFSTGQH
ncbi:hypothetical protein AN958_01618 [Leucoagaricus sp. SymC.cos]|nr:hypothetical protein AN958_01618 [Leucoagaricus sp. SymC.cos]